VLGGSRQGQGAGAARTRALRHERGAANPFPGAGTRLAGDAVELDEIEQLIIALQRADAVHFKARYRREAKPGLFGGDPIADSS
jgi:hypothetical protein